MGDHLDGRCYLTIVDRFEPASTTREAIVRGLRGLPGNEVLYRTRMRIEHQARNLAAVRNAYTELLSFLDDC